jgi:hypothetical protein
MTATRTASATARYARQMLLWMLVPALLVALVNGIVDPINLRGTQERGGWMHNKPALRDQERLFKPYAVVRQRPEVVLLGSSRSNHALDPAHRAFAGQRAYNLSLSGTNVAEIRAMFEHALAQGALRTAVIELDIGFFAPSAQGTAGGFDYADDVHARHPVRRTLRALQTAWSWDTFPLSLRTLRGQHEPFEYTDDGRQGDGVFEYRIATWGGVRNTFEGYTARTFPDQLALAQRWKTANQSAAGLPGMQDLRALLELARAHDVQVYLYVSPEHALGALVERVAFDPVRIDSWRAALVAMSDALADESGGRFVVPVWDFSGFSSVTQEPVPAPGDASARMGNYWEQSHYRKRVGDWILDRIFGLQSTGEPLPADFGVRLTTQNMAAHFASERAAADNYTAQHPDIAGFVARLPRGSGQPTEYRQ